MKTILVLSWVLGFFFSLIKFEKEDGKLIFPFHYGLAAAVGVGFAFTGFMGYIFYLWGSEVGPQEVLEALLSMLINMGTRE